MIIPANINHPELEPMAIRVASRRKINANIGNSALTSNVDEELRKLHTAVYFGADTVMDLSTGGDIPMIREAILRHSPVPIGTVPLYEALSRVKKVEDLSIDLYLEVIEEQVRESSDFSLNVTRTAASCRLCDAHLGQVFGDGPNPTGLRYCMNSLTLRFVEVTRHTATECAFPASFGIFKAKVSTEQPCLEAFVLVSATEFALRHLKMKNL